MKKMIVGKIIVLNVWFLNAILIFGRTFIKKMKKKILKECVRIAKEKNKFHTHTTFRHFSFVIQQNKILEWGINKSYGTPPPNVGYPENAGMHSENDVYRKAKGILDPKESFEVVNIRLNKSGDLRLSKPCPCCYNFLKNIGCTTVWFSTEIGFAKISLLT
jgi:hypothetical protein